MVSRDDVGDASMARLMLSHEFGLKRLLLPCAKRLLPCVLRLPVLVERLPLLFLDGLVLVSMFLLLLLVKLPLLLLGLLLRRGRRELDWSSCPTRRGSCSSCSTVCDWTWCCCSGFDCGSTCFYCCCWT